MVLTPATVLSATKWADLGLDHTSTGLRAAQRAVHPDICHDPQASAAFMRLTDLFDGPDFDLRIAKGRRIDGGIQWSFLAADSDLAQGAHEATQKLSKVADGHLWASQTTLSPDATKLTVINGPGWWPLREFGTLDERTVVWVAKRLMALAAVAESIGLVHGDVNPDTVMLHPAEHGLRLDGWWTAVPVGDKLAVTPAAPTLTKWMAGAAVGPELMVSQSAKMLLNHEAGPLTSVLEDLWLRPVAPSRAFERIDSTAKAAFGKPKWHPLESPQWN